MQYSDFTSTRSISTNERCSFICLTQRQVPAHHLEGHLVFQQELKLCGPSSWYCDLVICPLNLRYCSGKEVSDECQGIFPQIAIAIGVLTSNTGEADEPLWRIGRGTRVPLQGAIVVCYGWGAEGDDQFWWSGRGAIAGCHCSVL